MVFVGACSDAARSGVPCADLPTSWPPVNRGEPCIAPEGTYASAKDRACGYYLCLSGFWNDPQEGSGCATHVLSSEDSVRYCVEYCIADLEPSTPGLDEQCVFYSFSDELAIDVTPVRCDLVDGVWRVPETATFCVGLATSTGDGEARISDECASSGVNAEFVVVGDTGAAVPAGYEVGLLCAFEMYPVAPCPLELFDGPSKQPAVCTTGE